MTDHTPSATEPSAGTAVPAVPAFNGRVLVTGATGTVGWHITEQLADRDVEVRALVRDPGRARSHLPANVEVLAGDLTDHGSLTAALDGVQTVFHTAGIPEQWTNDPGIFDRVNHQVTRALAHAAREAGVSAFVYTSTIDVFRKTPGQPFDETVIEPEPLHTAYQRSKQMADRAVVAALEGGLPVRFLHPSALFGPSPSATPGLNDLIADLAANKLPALPPGGTPLVYAPDVARGHLLAAGAPVGSRFILSDRYLTLTELAQLVHRVVPTARVPRSIPLGLARTVSAVTERLARITKQPPLIPAGQLEFLTSNAVPNNGRASRDLGWKPTPLIEAITTTVEEAQRANGQP